MEYAAIAGAVGTGAGPIDLLPLYAAMSRRDDLDAEFERFFLAQFDSIVQSVAYVCGDAERARDATQEAFIKAYARWGTVRRHDNVGAWVRRVAINATRDAHRADARRRRREARVALPDTAANEVPAADDSVLHLLEQLPDRQRAIAALFYLDDLSTAEIAQVLAIAEGTVRFHLSHARARLREHLDRGHDRAR